METPTTIPAEPTTKTAQDMKDFAILVEKMRLAQKRYFELMARAKKSKHPDDFTAARNILTVSKELERQVDAVIESLA